MKITVDIAACRVYANCILEAPEVFDVDDAGGKVLVRIQEPGAELEDDVRRAVAACPVRAITIVE
ncbi:ferredoxin [Nocardia sp. CWNU-33]|uniref:ferredoxin n=1 Tax=Nocardia sp. CWNU-33 TaxID=3392117 RepID=UPI00398E4489